MKDLLIFIIFISLIGMDRVAPESRDNSALLPFLNLRNPNERNIVMLTEQFKPIKGYEGLYEISNFGRVKSFHKKPHLLSDRFDSSGYKQVLLCKEKIQKSFIVHLLVWDHFGDNLRNGLELQVDHIDNNKLNNKIDNLQLLTNRQNSTKQFLTIQKSSKFVGVCWDKSRNKWIVGIKINKKRINLGRFYDENEAAEVYQTALRKYEIS